MEVWKRNPTPVGSLWEVRVASIRIPLTSKLLTGLDGDHLGGDGLVVGRHRRAEAVSAFDGAAAARQHSGALEPPLGHALDEHLCVSVVVGMAVGDEDRIGLGRVQGQAAHVHQRRRSGVQVDPGPVVDVDASGGPDLVDGGESPAPSPQEGDAGRDPCPIVWRP